MSVMQTIFALIRGVIAPRADLLAENLALRQHLAVLKRHSKRLRLSETRPHLLGLVVAVLDALA